MKDRIITSAIAYLDHQSLDFFTLAIAASQENLLAESQVAIAITILEKSESDLS